MSALLPAETSPVLPPKWLTMKVRLIAIALGIWGSLVSGAISVSSAAEAPAFETDIRPIFREFCFDCHGATEKHEGNLDLRLVRFLEKGGDSGTALLRGNAAESLLLQRIKNGEMPPAGGHLTPEQISVVERWINAGAPTLRPEPETLGPGVPITPEERNYWAFRPITRPEVAPANPEDRIRTPIDALLKQAMPEGLRFSPDADRVTLVRRVYFDLLGLPPSVEELAKWTAHPDENWFELLVNEVLESPHYGERWARHWLDVAGYADSEGATLADQERPWSWLYRDYVIRSLNNDKPFDRFLHEQLAGDELAGPANGDWTPEQIELLTATGFLRTAADGTGSGDNSPAARNKVVGDTLKIISSSLLGLSLQCAQCHDHRYDPIPQSDYFAIRAVFEPALDWKKWRVPNERMVSLMTAAERQKSDEIEAEVQKVAAERAEKQKGFMQDALNKELEKYEQPLRDQLRMAYETAEKDRTPEQKALLDKNPSVKITPGVLYQYLPAAAEELKKYDAKIAEMRATKPVHRYVRALVEPGGEPPVTHLFYRGEFEQPKQEVGPAALSVVSTDGTRYEFPKDDPALPTTGRRLAFAKWLTSAENPLTSRVLVNRIWMHHFGRGLVPTPGDFGKLGSEPTHPELLDWLASEFMAKGWSLKQLHRTILGSTAWRQSSYRDPAMNALDPENRFYWRKSLQRLDAEILRDRMLAASGTLNRDLFGEPIPIKEDETGQVIVDGQQTRRSLYIRIRRTQPVGMLQTFDAPVMETNCEFRPVSTVATQSLMLMNGEFTLEQAGRLADRVIALNAPLPQSLQKLASELPPGPAPLWEFGSGVFDSEKQRTSNFRPLPHWTGSQWQGSDKLPDPQIGWVLLHAGGGHPGNPQFATVRRWTAPRNGTVELTGTLSHGGGSGDGVRGRLVSSQQGLLGEWIADKGKADTKVSGIAVSAGDTLDLIVDCRANENADSYGWSVQFNLKDSEGTATAFHSENQFRGPSPDPTLLPAQVYQAWMLALSRPPTEDEFRLAMEFASRQLTDLHQEPRGVATGSTPVRQVLVNLCQMLFNLNEFVYVD